LQTIPYSYYFYFRIIDGFYCKYNNLRPSTASDFGRTTNNDLWSKGGNASVGVMDSIVRDSAQETEEEEDQRSC
jgi:hypothetical protein